VTEASTVKRARIGGSAGVSFLLHPATVLAGHAPDLDVEVDPLVAAGEIPDLAPFAVVPPALTPPAGPTGCFFDRRVRVMMRA
jgi:hypothetical protein